MKNIVILDGLYMLFQMFFGMPARITGKDNKPVHAVIGFTGALLKIANNL